MKKILILQLLFIHCIIGGLYSQILVRQTGKVVVGEERDHDNDLTDMITMAIYGKYGNNRCGGKIGFGDFGTNAAWNVFLGEWGTEDSDQLWLHGKYGTYLTRGDNAEWLSVVAYYNSKEGNKFTFNCPIYSQGVLLTSDERLKSNVNNIDNSLSLIKKLDGVSFNYSYDNLLKLNNVKSSENDILPLSTDASKLNPKEQAAIAERERIMDLMKKEAKKKKLGFLAQEVQKVFPELVVQDSCGYYYVDYIGLIPVIVEAIKEQQTEIEALKQVIASLEEKDNSLPHLRSTTVQEEGNTSLQTPAIAACRLEQNTPNPFNMSTNIKYYLPETIVSAYLCIYDMQGKQLKQIALTQRGEGSEVISASQLNPGMYLYALVADGQEVDVKRMILTE